MIAGDVVVAWQHESVCTDAGKKKVVYVVRNKK